jgi:hypothetical protein
MAVTNGHGRVVGKRHPLVHREPLEVSMLLLKFLSDYL